VLPVEQEAALALKEAEDGEAPLTANEEICFLTWSLLQSGQVTPSVEKPATSDSKGLPHSWQTNS